MPFQTALPSCCLLGWRCRLEGADPSLVQRLQQAGSTTDLRTLLRELHDSGKLRLLADGDSPSDGDEGGEGEQEAAEGGEQEEAGAMEADAVTAEAGAEGEAGAGQDEGDREGRAAPAGAKPPTVFRARLHARLDGAGRPDSSRPSVQWYLADVRTGREAQAARELGAIWRAAWEAAGTRAGPEAGGKLLQRCAFFSGAGCKRFWGGACMWGGRMLAVPEMHGPPVGFAAKRACSFPAVGRAGARERR